MSAILPGQRWMSESEPELGLGQIREISERFVVISFAGSEVERRYTMSSAPLRRVQFRKGDKVESRTGEFCVVERVETVDGLFVYHGAGLLIREEDLSDRLSFDSPEQRLPMGQWDAPDDFQLRLDALELLCQWYRSPVRGLVGGRMSLLPHQLYVVQQAISRQQPRLLLADEAGLGKTIEACLILHHLLAVGRIERVLILLPESLVHQWFVELLRRFSLVFQIVDEPYCLAQEEAEPGSNPFALRQLNLCDIDTLLHSPQRYEQALEAGWDMVIVDEAHHIKDGTEVYQKILKLTSCSWGALLVTATPEQLGLESHFARLRLLDPERYSDFDDFIAQSKTYQQLASLIDSLLQDNSTQATKQAIDVEGIWKDLDIETSQGDAIKAAFSAEAYERKEVVQTLLDRYGMGRVMFRNTRAAVEGFPVREVHLYPLEAEPDVSIQDDPRIAWLADFLRNNKDKVLLICKTKELVQSISEILPHHIHLPTALFHEQLTLIQRDRNAVWFADPDGAQLLLCSEVGGEGRNFQCAHHLVLFDVPHDPELLEQRIGRLDRIGQGDRIFLHIPYLKHTEQEVWVRWFHEGLDALSHTFPAGFRALEEFEPRLKELSEAQAFLEFWDDDEYDTMSEFNLTQELAVDTMISDTVGFRDALLEQLEAGRNRLLALSSYAPESAMQTLLAILKEEGSRKTVDIVSRLFQYLGVDIEPLTELTWDLQPGMGLHEDFPWLTGELMRVSFDREFALQHATTVFLSLDHPMVVGAMDLLLGTSAGNCSVALWEEGEQPVLLLEAIFVLECVAPRPLNIERFLPPTPIRLVVDHHLDNVSSEYPSHVWGDELVPGVPEQLLQHKVLFEEQVPSMLRACRKLAITQQSDLLALAATEVEQLLEPEIQRLSYLQTVNPAVSKDDIRLAEQELASLQAHIQQARLRLDAVRFILKG